MTRVGDAVPSQGEGRKSRAYIYILGEGVLSVVILYPATRQVS